MFNVFLAQVAKCRCLSATCDFTFQTDLQRFTIRGQELNSIKIIKWSHCPKASNLRSVSQWWRGCCWVFLQWQWRWRNRQLHSGDLSCCRRFHWCRRTEIGHHAQQDWPCSLLLQNWAPTTQYQCFSDTEHLSPHCWAGTVLSAKKEAARMLISPLMCYYSTLQEYSHQQILKTYRK